MRDLKVAVDEYINYLRSGKPLNYKDFQIIRGRIVTIACNLVNAKDAVDIEGDVAGMRHFGTGATRDQDTTKPDYEGFISPLVTKK